MQRDLILLLTGAAVALVSSLLTVFIQHVLSLRAEKSRRQLEREEKAAQELKERLSEGTDLHLRALKEKLAVTIPSDLHLRTWGLRLQQLKSLRPH